MLKKNFHFSLTHLCQLLFGLLCAGHTILDPGLELLDLLSEQRDCALLLLELLRLALLHLLQVHVLRQHLLRVGLQVAVVVLPWIVIVRTLEIIYDVKGALINSYFFMM